MKLVPRSRAAVVASATMALLIASVTTAMAAHHQHSKNLRWDKEYCQRLLASGKLATTTNRKAFCAKRYGISVTTQPIPGGSTSPGGDASVSPTGQPTGGSDDSPGRGQIVNFAKRIPVSTVFSGVGDLAEISGVDVSRKYQGFFWVHNDSGDGARIFLIDGQAKHRATVRFRGVSSRDLDLEDIAVGPGPRDDTGYIYVADIGNNDARRDNCCTVFRLAEPDLTLTGTGVETLTVDVEAMRFDYHGVGTAAGKRDAEALMIDPVANRLYAISKTTDDTAPSNLYEIEFRAGATDGAAQYVKTIEQRGIVAADMSADGTGIVTG